ncbi:MAG: hypothetical protein V1913_12900 [Fibrobacterota bacterium]
MSDKEILVPWVDKILELAGKPEQEIKKKLWADHQDLRGTVKAPVSVYYEGIPGPQWDVILGAGFRKCVGETAREIEFFLRRVIWAAENVADDHIVWPLMKLWVPTLKKRGWGVNTEHTGTHNPLEAAALAASMKGPIDVSILTEPLWEVDEAAWARKKEEALALTENRLDIYAYHDNLGTSPFDMAAEMRGIEQIMMDAIDDPDDLHRLMDFITSAYEKQHLFREKKGWLNQQLVDRSGNYQPVLEHRIHCAHMTHGNRNNDRTPRLRHEWPYVSAQTSSGFGPDMFKEFVHDYNCRLARHFSQKTVYYHGCETLDQKIIHTQHLPNLRRQHVSPWSTVARAVEVLQGKAVMEVHAHPGKVLFGMTESDMRKEIRGLLDAAKEMPMDLNLSDIHTLNGKSETLALWARVAQEEATKR